MNYWIGIIGSKASYTKFINEEKKWFCLPDNADAGDLIYIYFSKKAFKKNGIYKLYEVISKNEQDYSCKQYGGFAIQYEALKKVNIELKKEFKKQMTAADMKTNPFLSASVFVRRNFQATYFEICEKKFEIIYKLIDS
jgi:hypothetical protein